MGGTDGHISVLFDVFVVNQRLRSLLGAVMVDAGMRADEYAVYSLLFERGPLSPTQLASGLGMPLTTVLDYLREIQARGHASRRKNPADGRSYLVALNMAGVRAHRVANAFWEKARAMVEAGLGQDMPDVVAALRALDEAVAGAARALVADGAARTG